MSRDRVSHDWYGASMDDAALVGLALANPQQGVAAIYDRYGTSLYNYCHSILRSQADAGDALQESFVTVMDKLGQLRDPAKLRPWLYAIARNQCYKRHRQRNRERPEDPNEFGEEQTVMAASTTEPTPGAELVAMVWEATSGLSEVDRSVLELNIRHELDGEELAASLGVPGPKCSVMLHRAKDRLKTAVGALIVAKVGADACGDLAGIVHGNEFNPLVRKRVSRHITSCAVCEETERRHRPEAYLAAVPLLSVPASVHKGVLAAIRSGAGSGAAPGTGSLSGDGVSGWSAADDFELWNDAGFPQVPATGNSSAAKNGGPSRPLLVVGATVCAIGLVVLLALLNPFGNETTVVAGPATGAQPTALPRPEFLPTLPPVTPTVSASPVGENLAVAEPTTTPTPTPTIEPTPVPAAPTSPPVQPAATQLPVPPTATPFPSPTPIPSATPSPAPTPSPTQVPTPTPTPTPVVVDFVAPVVDSFTVSCGDPFMLTVTVSDNLDPSPIVDLEATWDDEADPAVVLTKMSGNTYRANVPRSELNGENIDFFVRGTLTDNAANSRVVDETDDCTIIG